MFCVFTYEFHPARLTDRLIQSQVCLWSIWYIMLKGKYQQLHVLVISKLILVCAARPAHPAKCPVVLLHLSVFITCLLSSFDEKQSHSRTVLLYLQPNWLKDECCVFIPDAVFLHGAQIEQVLVHIKNSDSNKLFWVQHPPLPLL